MEHINKVINGLGDSSRTRNGSENGPSEAVSRRAAAVWEAMKAIYGTSFLTIHGEEPHPIWIAEIAKLTDQQARAGLTKLAAQQRDYPANLTIFLEACKGNDSPRFLGTPTTPRQLLHNKREFKRASPETVNRHIENMRKLFR